jgi:hypothetical protein
MFLGLPDPDPFVRVSDPESDPDPLVRGMDPRIRIRTNTDSKDIGIRKKVIQCLSHGKNVEREIEISLFNNF